MAVPGAAAAHPGAVAAPNPKVTPKKRKATLQKEEDELVQGLVEVVRVRRDRLEEPRCTPRLPSSASRL